MRYPPAQAARYLEEAKKVFEEPGPPDVKLWKLWLTLLFLRGASIAGDLRRMLGDRVYSGPFKGMQLTDTIMTGGFAPHLLGCYEHELHATFEQVIASDYQKILNIGCSFGYYAVGLALRMPHVQVDAFDISEKARMQCVEMTELNGVQQRVTVGGEFRGEDFAGYSGTKTLALVDIEGAERTLLDPARYPALANMDLIIEMHDVLDPSISKLMLERFAATHECEVILNQGLLFPLDKLPGVGGYVDPFDSLIASWEVRDGLTPWGVMRAKR